MLKKKFIFIYMVKVMIDDELEKKKVIKQNISFKQLSKNIIKMEKL